MSSRKELANAIRALSMDAKSPEHLLRAFLFDLFSIIANSAKILCINRSFSPPHHQP
ncbi:hypothetical protein ACXIZ5_13775 [Klebsiella pneumoniae]